MGFPSHYEEPPGQYPIPVQDQHQVFLSQFRLQAGEQPGEFSVVGCFMAAVLATTDENCARSAAAWDPVAEIRGILWYKLTP